MLMHLHWTYAWALWALPLALLPLFNQAEQGTEDSTPRRQ